MARPAPAMRPAPLLGLLLLCAAAPALGQTNKRLLQNLVSKFFFIYIYLFILFIYLLNSFIPCGKLVLWF